MQDKSKELQALPVLLAMMKYALLGKEVFGALMQLMPDRKEELQQDSITIVDIVGRQLDNLARFTGMAEDELQKMNAEAEKKAQRMVGSGIPIADIPPSDWDKKTYPVYVVGNSGAIWKVIGPSESPGYMKANNPPSWPASHFDAEIVEARGDSKPVGTKDKLHWSLFRGDGVSTDIEEARRVRDNSFLSL